jgi:hypothetical protein
MDLLTVVPGCREYLKPFTSVLLFSSSHKTAEIRSKPLIRFTSEGYSVQYYIVTGDPPETETGKVSGVCRDSSVVYFSFEDALADCFGRGYKMIVEGRVVWDATLLWHEHSLLSLAAGGVFGNQDDLKRACRRILLGVEHACRRFGDLYRVRSRLSA